MSTIIDSDFSQVKLICRPEGDGFLIYAPHSGAYIYATPSGRDLVTTLTEVTTENDPATVLADRLGLAPAIATSWVQLTAKLLAGARPQETDLIGIDREQVGIWLLEEVMGDKGQRCETFGMPF
jgi:hypothetical protein